MSSKPPQVLDARVDVVFGSRDGGDTDGRVGGGGRGDALLLEDGLDVADVLKIVESRRGRAFEVTPEREIVWEFINPNRTARDESRTAQLMDLRRLGPDFPLEWLGAPHVSVASPRR